MSTSQRNSPRSPAVVKPPIPHFASVLNTQQVREARKNSPPSIDEFKNKKKMALSGSISPQRLIEDSPERSVHMLRHLGNYALNQTEPFQMSMSKAIHKEDSKISFLFQDSESLQRSIDKKNKVASKYRAAADQYVKNSLHKWQNFPQKPNTLEDMKFTSTDYKLMMSLRPQRMQQTRIENKQGVTAPNEMNKSREEEEEQHEHTLTTNPPSFFIDDEEKWKKRWEVINEKSPRKNVKLPALSTKQRTMRPIDYIVEGNTGEVSIAQRKVDHLLRKKMGGETNKGTINFETGLRMYPYKGPTNKDSWKITNYSHIGMKLPYVKPIQEELEESKKSKASLLSKSMVIPKRQNTPKQVERKVRIKQKKYNDNFKNAGGVRHLFNSYQQIEQMHWGNSLRDYPSKKPKKQ